MFCAKGLVSLILTCEFFFFYKFTLKCITTLQGFITINEMGYEDIVIS